MRKLFLSALSLSALSAANETVGARFLKDGARIILK